MPIEAHIIYSEKPSGPAPAGVVPDPPGYKACVVFLRSYLKTNPAAPTSNGVLLRSPLELRQACEREYVELKAITLNTLISWYWEIGEGMSLGVSATEEQVKERLASVNKTLFATPAGFADYLRWTDETMGDMVFRSRVQYFEAKIRANALAAAKADSKIADPKKRQAALAGLSEALSPAGRWVARTSCVRGFVVSSCKQYKGPFSPGLPD